MQCKGFAVCPLGEMYEMRRPGYQLPRNSDWPQRLRAGGEKAEFSTLLLSIKTKHLFLNLGKSRLGPAGQGLTLMFVDK